MPDIACQLNGAEFTDDLFTVDDVNNDAIFKQNGCVTNKYVTVGSNQFIHSVADVTIFDNFYG